MALDTTRSKAKEKVTTSDIESEIANLREDMSKIVEKLAVLAENSTADFAAKAESAAQKGLKNGQEMSRQLEKQLADLDKNMSRAVRENPLPAIGIAAGVGFLAALLLRR